MGAFFLVFFSNLFYLASLAWLVFLLAGQSPPSARTQDDNGRVSAQY
jgi:hypothetical protein